MLILRSLERQEARRRIVKEELAKTNEDIIVLRPKTVRRIQLRKRGKDETKELAEAEVETKKVEEAVDNKKNEVVEIKKEIET